MVKRRDGKDDGRKHVIVWMGKKTEQSWNHCAQYN